LVLSSARSTFKPSAEKTPSDIDNNETQSIDLYKKFFIRR